jgi:hypothetical protein
MLSDGTGDAEYLKRLKDADALEGARRSGIHLQRLRRPDSEPK